MWQSCNDGYKMYKKIKRDAREKLLVKLTKYVTSILKSLGVISANSSDFTLRRMNIQGEN